MWLRRFFETSPNRILPEMGVMPDTDFKSPSELIAQETKAPEAVAKQREEVMRAEESRDINDAKSRRAR